MNDGLFHFFFVKADGAVPSNGVSDLSLLCVDIGSMNIDAAKKTSIVQSTPMKDVFGAPATFNNNGLTQLRQNSQLSFGFETQAVNTNATFNINDFGQLTQNAVEFNPFFFANATAVDNNTNPINHANVAVADFNIFTGVFPNGNDLSAIKSEGGQGAFNTKDFGHNVVASNRNNHANAAAVDDNILTGVLPNENGFSVIKNEVDADENNIVLKKEK